MEERLMVCDEAGNDQYIETRTRVHTLGLWHRVIHIWVYDEEYLYIQQRAFTKKAFPGAYDITVAGHIDPHEDADTAALRECEEELNIKLAKDQLTLLGMYKESLIHGEDIDRELAQVYAVKQSIVSFEPLNEVIALGKVPLQEIHAILQDTLDQCHFYDLATKEIRLLNKEQLFIHALDYYVWVLEQIMKNS